MNVLVVLLFNMFQPKLLTCIVFYVKIVKLETQQDIFQSRRRFSCKSIKQKLSDTFMQLTRVFSGHIFQNCFNFEESAWETYPCECMRACKRVKYFENLPLSGVRHCLRNELHIFHHVANILRNIQYTIV